MRSPVRRVPTGALVLMLVIPGCGAVQRSVTPKAPAAARTHAVDPPKTAAGRAAVIHVARTAYGQALTDRHGFALYLFTRDRSAKSACYGACAAAWPPYVVATRPPDAALDAHAGLIDSVRRQDGRLQVTYAGHPLYHYVGDRRPGQVLCQAVPEFGGTWYVVAPSGNAIH